MTEAEIIKLDQENIWHPFTPLINSFGHIPIQSAKGVKLYTYDDKIIIDAISSWWVNIHGHGNEVLAKALYDQALKMEHVIFAGFTHEPAVKLSQNLLQILPKGFSKIFFSDDGSTAVEVALKMAVQYWHNLGYQNRHRIIAFEGAYHGDTFGAMSVGARGSFFDPFAPMLFDVSYIPLPTSDNFEQVKAQFESLINQDHCAAFIFEPLVQGSGGMRMYGPHHLNELILLAQAKNLPCIADEVMTGFGRTGKTFAIDHIAADPDIICLSKGITGGTMAMGVTACHQKIVNAFESNDVSKAFLHGHSYTGNPLACAAANASFELFQSEECNANINRITASHLNFMERLSASNKVENVRSLGTIVAFDLKGFGATGYDSAARKIIYSYFLERGILIRPLGNVIYLMPPYIISEQELDTVYQCIINFLESL